MILKKNSDQNKKSEEKDQDYIEYRGKSPAQIILTIQRNLFALQLNPSSFLSLILYLFLIYMINSMYSSSDYWNKFILLYCDFPYHDYSLY